MSEEEQTPEESAGKEPAPSEGADLAEGLPGVAGGASALPSGTWKAKDVTDNDRLMAAIAYATQVVIPVIVPAIMLLAEESKARPFQRYHAVQSLGVLVASVVYEVLAAIIYCGLSTVTGGCLACILWVIFLAPAAPALYYAYQAYQGFYFKIPVLTDFLVQNKWLEMPEEA